MNNYISIFPNTHPNMSGSICIGAGNILAETKEDAILQTAASIPYMWPYLVYEKIYYDTTFHNAYEPDWSNPDGMGMSENMKRNYVAQGFLENW